MSLEDAEKFVAGGWLAWVKANALRLVEMVVVIIVAGFVVWKIFFAGDAAKVAVATANGQAALATAGAASGHESVEIVTGNAAQATDTQSKVRRQINVITHAPGAGVPVSDPVDATGRDSVCMLVAAAGCPGGQ